MNDLDTGDFLAFMDSVNDEVMEDWLEQTFGHRARETANLNELSVAEAMLLHDGIVMMMHDAEESGDLLRYAIGWRLRKWIMQSNNDVMEYSEQAMERAMHPSSIEEVMRLFQ